MKLVLLFFIFGIFYVLTSPQHRRQRPNSRFGQHFVQSSETSYPNRGSVYRTNTGGGGGPGRFNIRQHRPNPEVSSNNGRPHGNHGGNHGNGSNGGRPHGNEHDDGGSHENGPHGNGGGSHGNGTHCGGSNGNRHGGRPHGNRPQGGRPHGNGPQGGRPHGNRPQGGRPHGNGPQGGRPHGNGPQGGRPHGDEPHGGGSDESNEDCQPKPIIHGHWSKWESGSCSVTCGKGKKKKTRTCKYACGNDCDPSSEKKPCKGKSVKKVNCNKKTCALPGTWSAWKPAANAKGRCSATCGGGKKVMKRKCIKQGRRTARCKGKKKKTVKCNNQACENETPVNGNWGAWGASGSCSVSCGTGTQLFERSCDNPTPLNGGNDCSGENKKSEPCNTEGCPVDGGWTNYSPDGNCSATCGGGEQNYERFCTNPPPANGGADCEGDDSKTETCNEQACSIHGGWSSWTEGQCSVTCGGGQQIDKRTCTDPAPAHGGKDCEGDKTKTEVCNEQACPVPGGWSSWTEGQCSVTCGGGQQIDKRTCTDPAPANGGKDCVGDETKTQTCNEQACPVHIDGGWSAWIQNGSCSATCGGGSLAQYRLCNNPTPENNGKVCVGSRVNVTSCNTQGCTTSCNEKSISPRDYCFVVDSSGSIGSKNFVKVRKFTASLIESASIGCTKGRFSYIRFSSTMNIIFNISDYLTKEALVKAVLNVNYNGGKTHTKTALEWAKNYCFVDGPACTRDIDKIVIVITDGNPTKKYEPGQAAEDLKSVPNLLVYAIGVGTGISLENLKKIASDDSRVIRISSFDFLDSEKCTISNDIVAGDPFSNSTSIIRT